MKNLYKLLVVVLLGFTATIQAQFIPVFNDDLQLDDFGGESLPLKDLEPVATNPEPEIGDIQFGYNVQAALNASSLIRSAYKKKLNHWINKQNNVLKKEIEKQLNKTFPNFHEAQKAFFKNLEFNNTKQNIGSIKYPNEAKNDASYKTQKASSARLKSLLLRKKEIASGNLNNSIYKDLNYNSKSLGAIKNVSIINNYIQNETKSYIGASIVRADSRAMANVIDGILSVNSTRYEHYLNYMYDLQMQHYNKYDVWKRVDLMQLYLNRARINLYYVTYSKPGSVYARDFGNTTVIKKYASSHKGIPASVFHPDYPRFIAGKYISSSEDRYEALDRAEQEVEILRQKELDKIVNDVDLLSVQIQSLIDEVGIDQNSKEFSWLHANKNVAKEIVDFANKNRVNNILSSEAKQWVLGQTELNGLEQTIIVKWKKKSGKINGREDQKYTHIFSDGVRSYYKLTDGSTVINSPNRLYLGKDNSLVEKFTSEINNKSFWYIRTPNSNLWSNYLIKESTALSDELRVLFKLGATELGSFIGTYVLPIEDIKILIDGKDFNGQATSKWLTAGVLLVGIIPGTKVFKVVAKVGGKFKIWRVVVESGGKIYTRVITKISSKVASKYKQFSLATEKLINDLLKKGEYSNEIIEEVSEIIEDLSITKGSKLSWNEIKILFKRGNDFNRKAIKEKWYKYFEIHLANGKRLDSYDDVLKEIISRKATDLGNIKFSTFDRYLKEFVSKYKVGTKIRSNKYLKELDGKLLEGTYILEIPDSNKTLPNIQTFIDHAWNNYKVKIRFRPE